MADVNVTVMIDGKAAFVVGAVGAPDANAHAIGALQYGLRHFQDILASRAPAPLNPASALQGGAFGPSQAAKSQDTSL